MRAAAVCARTYPASALFTSRKYFFATALQVSVRQHTQAERGSRARGQQQKARSGATDSHADTARAARRSSSVCLVSRSM